MTTISLIPILIPILTITILEYYYRFAILKITQRLKKINEEFQSSNSKKCRSIMAVC